MLFLQYPPCSTCQKAKKWLDEHGIVYTARHIKEDNPTVDELRAWIAASGLPIKRFFNTSGLVYKNLGLKDKLPAMSEEEQIALLASDGMQKRIPAVAAGILCGLFSGRKQPQQHRGRSPPAQAPPRPPADQCRRG